MLYWPLAQPLNSEQAEPGTHSIIGVKWMPPALSRLVRFAMGEASGWDWTLMDVWFLQPMAFTGKSAEHLKPMKGQAIWIMAMAFGFSLARNGGQTSFS